MKITTELTLPILHHLKSFIDCNINIVDENGTIVASGEPERLHTIHKGAVEVLKLKNELIIDNERSELLYGSRPEINLPIVFQDNIIGVIGIDVIGDIKFKYKLARAIKMIFEVLLNQMHMYNQVQYKQKSIEAWIADLINPNEFDVKKLEAIAPTININYEIDRAAIIISIENPGWEIVSPSNFSEHSNELLHKISNFISNCVDQRSIYSFTRLNNYVMFIPFNGKGNQEEKMAAEQIKNTLDKLGVTSFIGIGERNKGIEGYRESFFQAFQSLNLLKKLNSSKGYVHIADWGIVRLIDSVPEHTRKKFLDSYESFKTNSTQELEQTLEVFLECDMNITEAATKLHCHRNTLLYRLERIYDLLHLDPRKFTDAITLKLLLISKKLDA